jgi:hypothetical protein
LKNAVIIRKYKYITILYKEIMLILNNINYKSIQALLKKLKKVIYENIIF